MSSLSDETAEANARIGQTVLGRYRLDALLGIGGIGQVFRALDAESGDIVAVKTLRPAMRSLRVAHARFLREARICHSLEHPAIPRGITSGIDQDEVPLLVMEFVAGTDLGAMVDRDGPMDPIDALWIGARVAEALDYAHQRGIVHRDVKPENIMLVGGASIPEGIMVMDFGIAHWAQEQSITSTGQVLGSPGYLSPEQVRCEPLTPAADLYGLGASLVFLLTGETLYSGGNTLEQVMAHVLRPLPDLAQRMPELPQPVVRYLETLLAREPSGRPTSAEMVARSLRQLATWMENTSAKPPVLSALEPGQAIGERVRLLERMQEMQKKLHMIMQSTAASQARLVNQLVDLSARRLERRHLEFELSLLGSEPSPRAASLRASMAALGDPEADRHREQLLESALDRLHRQMQEDQGVILHNLRDAERQLVESY